MLEMNFNGCCRMLRGNEREKADKRLIYILDSCMFDLVLPCVA